MDSRARAQPLVDQLAGDIDLEGSAFDEDGLIGPQVGDGLVLTIAADPDEPALTLCAYVGGPVDALPAATLRDLPREDGEARAADGASFAVEPTTGRLVLQQRLPLAALDCAAFKGVLERVIADQDAAAATLADRLRPGSGAADGSGSAADVPALRDSPAGLG